MPCQTLLEESINFYFQNSKLCKSTNNTLLATNYLLAYLVIISTSYHFLAGCEKTPMVRGEENGGRLVYMYEPRSTFVSISCCHIHVCNNLLLICKIIETIPSLQGVLIVPLAMGLLTLFMMFYWKTICVCLDMSEFQLPLT